METTKKREWKVAQMHNDQWLVEDQNGRIVAYVTDEPMNPRGNGWDEEDWDRGPAGMRENADLIAAAPDLLRAVELQLAALDGSLWDTHRMLEADRALQAALKKARGEGEITA